MAWVYGTAPKVQDYVPDGVRRLIDGVRGTDVRTVWIDGRAYLPPAPTPDCKHRRLCVVYQQQDGAPAGKLTASRLACADCDADGQAVVQPGCPTAKWL